MSRPVACEEISQDGMDGLISASDEAPAPPAAALEQCSACDVKEKQLGSRKEGSRANCSLGAAAGASPSHAHHEPAAQASQAAAVAAPPAKQMRQEQLEKKSRRRVPMTRNQPFIHPVQEQKEFAKITPPGDARAAELPISAHREEILRVYSSCPAFLLLGETGSGKSTQLAKILADNGHCRVVCSEPRVLAATTLARRVAVELMQSGRQAQVGCATTAAMLRQMPDSKRVCYTTHRALLMTAAIEPYLQAFDCVILDEAHERSVETDLLLGVLRRISDARPNFRLVLASATLAQSASKFSEYLGSCPSIHVKGREFSVSVTYLNLSFTDKDVSKTCVGVVRQVLLEHDTGGLLCFLPSVVDIDLACSLLTDGNLEVLPLHSKLTPDEQARVFTAPHSRRVVFTTNIAETAVTVPGTCIVVDCGFERSRVWCAQGSSKLITSIISKSSATQRAGRAGREQPGHCYRLYSKEEFDAMDAAPVPEILRVELCSAILRTRALGINDLSEISLIDPPDEVAWSSGEEQLCLLGALEADGRGLLRLTPMGKAMSFLPVEPRLAAVALGGMDAQSTRVAVALAALLTVAGRLFFRAGTCAQKDRADRHKLEFATVDGDVTTMLKVFASLNSHRNKREARSWCARHSINSKSLLSAREIQVEMERAILPSLPDQFDTSLQDALETHNEFVRKLFLGAFFQNVCVYTGFPEDGYMLLRDRTARVFIHPSSVLARVDTCPRWIIFYDRLTTSQDFVTTCTALDSEWLLEVLTKNQLCWLGLGDEAAAQARAIKELDESIMQECKVRPGLSPLVLQEMTALNLRLADVEELICKQAGPCRLRARAESCNGRKVVLWARPDILDVAKSIVDRQLKEVEDSVSGEVVLRSLSDAGSVKFVQGRGMAVLTLLEPGEFCALEIRCQVADQESLSRSHIKAALVCAGLDGGTLNLHNLTKRKEPISSIASSANSEVVGVLTMKSSADAEMAMLRAPLLVGSTALQLIPIHLDSDASCTQPRRPRDITADLIWRRRPFTGCCRVACRPGTSDLALACFRNLELRHRRIGGGIIFGDYRLNASSDRQKLDTIFVRDIDLQLVIDADSAAEVLKRFFQDGLISPAGLLDEEMHLQDIITDVHLPRSQAPTDEQDALVLTSFKHQIEKVLSENHVPRNSFTLEVPQPKPKDFDYKARLRFDGNANHLVVNAITAIQTLHVENAAGMSVLNVVPRFSTSVKCLRRAYQAVSSQVTSFIQATQPQGKNPLPRVKVCDNTSGSFTTIIIDAASPAALAKVRSELSRILDGSELNLNAQSGFEQHLFSKRGRIFIDDVMKKAGNSVFLLADWRTRVLRVWGTVEACEAAQASLDEHVTRLGATTNIQLQGHGVVKALIQRHGVNLDEWASKFGAGSVLIDLKRSILSITGSDTAVRKSQELIAQLTEVQRQPGVTEECGICFCQVDAVHVQLICGHIFCKDCLKLQVNSECTSGNFTAISCATCGEPLALREILQIANRRQLQMLENKALDQFVRESQGQFHCCTTSGCRGIYKARTTQSLGTAIRENSIWFMCPECGQGSCRFCHRPMHEGLTCAAAAESDAQASTASLDALKKKIVEEMLTLKCPRSNCQQAYDDFDGCCALQCCRCSCVFCGWCLKDCSASGDAHGHVASCPEKPEGVDALFPYPRSKFEDHWIFRKERAVTNELLKHGPAVRKALIQQLNPILQGLNMRISTNSRLFSQAAPEGRAAVALAPARAAGGPIEAGGPIVAGQAVDADEGAGDGPETNIGRRPCCIM